MMCIRPLPGGMYNSTVSLKRISPTLSRLRMAEAASTPGGFGGEFAFGIRHRAEIRRRADIDHQQDGQFALLGEELDVRLAGARGDIPIDGADIIARHIVSNTIEIHAAALEDAGIAPGQRVIDEPVGADFHPPDAAEDFRGAGLVLDADGRAGFGWIMAPAVRRGCA